MKVEFATRTTDLKKAIREIGVNRESHSATDSTDILVSKSNAIFRSVGTEADLPVHGSHLGSVRVPFIVLEKMAGVLGTFKKDELKILCEPGCLKTGTFAIKHPDIKLGIIPNRKISVPINLPLLDTVALARVLSSRQVAEQGLRARIEEAQKSCSQAISLATSALEPLGCDEKQIRCLVDERIAEAAQRLRRAIAS